MSVQNIVDTDFTLLATKASPTFTGTLTADTVKITGYQRVASNPGMGKLESSAYTGASVTISETDLYGGIVVLDPSATQTATTPTAADLNTLLVSLFDSVPVGFSFEVLFQNANTTNASTLAAGSGFIIAGSGITIAPGGAVIVFIRKSTTIPSFIMYGAYVLENVGTAGAYTTVTTDAKGRVTAGTMATQSPATRTIQTVAAAANGWQLSSTRAAIAMYSVRITAASGTEGAIVVEINPANTAVAGEWIETGRVNLGESGGITPPTCIGGGQVSAFVPVGYYVRVRSINLSGTPGFTYQSGQEILF